MGKNYFLNRLGLCVFINCSVFKDPYFFRLLFWSHRDVLYHLIFCLSSTFFHFLYYTVLLWPVCSHGLLLYSLFPFCQVFFYTFFIFHPLHTQPESSFAASCLTGTLYIISQPCSFCKLFFHFLSIFFIFLIFCWFYAKNNL